MAQTVVRDAITSSYPYQIAEVYRQLRNLDDTDYSGRITRLKELFEVCVKTLTSLAIKQFILDGKRCDNIRERICALDNPSLGHWVGLLRDICKEYQDGDGLPVHSPLPEMARFLDEKLPDGRNGEVFRAWTLAAEMLATKPSGNKNRDLMDFWVQVRNHLGAGGHGASHGREADQKEACETLSILMEHLVAQLGFLKEYPFIHIDQVLMEGGRPVFKAKTLVGTNINRGEYRPAGGNGECALIDKEVYVTKSDPKAELQNELCWALSLSPFLLLESCKYCKADQVFFLNGKRGKTLQYISYQCGHSYYPPDLQGDLQDIKKVLLGDVSARDIFRSRVLGATVEAGATGVTPEDKRRALGIAADCLQYLRESEPELAIRRAQEAIRLDEHCAEAYFAAGLAHLQLDEMSAAEPAADRAVEYDNASARAWLLKAVTALETGKRDEAERAILRAQEIDAASPFAAELLKGLDSYKPAASGDLMGEKRRGKAAELVVRILAEGGTARVAVRSWLLSYPPWSLVQHTRLPPAFACIGIALVLFAAVSLGNVALWSGLFFAKFGVICAICFTGLYFHYLVSWILSSQYEKLRRAILLPPAALRQWFLGEIAGFWGSINFAQDVVPAHGLREAEVVPKAGEPGPSSDVSDGAPKDNDGGGVKEGDVDGPLRLWMRRLVADREMLAVSALLFVLLAPVQIICANDSFEFTPGCLLRYFLYLLELFLCVWPAHLILRSLLFVPSVLKQPVRFFMGIPQSLSITALGHMYVGIGALAAIFTTLFLIQHYIFGTHEFALWACISLVAVEGIFAVTAVIGPQIAIVCSWRRLRERRLAQFSLSLEKTFDRFVKEPTSRTDEELRSMMDYMHYMRRNLPKLGLSSGHVLSVACLILYFAAVAGGYIYAIL